MYELHLNHLCYHLFNLISAGQFVYTYDIIAIQCFMWGAIQQQYDLVIGLRGVFALTSANIPAELWCGQYIEQ